MLWRLFNKSTDAGAAPVEAAVPEGRRVYVVGDIHGRDDLLRALHGMIVEDANAHPARDRVVVYLGDYVDRGPGSFQVLEMLLRKPLRGFASVFLRGNHEEMMLRFLDGPADPNWLFNGGDATVASYGVAVCWKDFQPPELERLRVRLNDAVPPEHVAFLEDLRLYHEEGDYAFVHAGLRPGVPIDKQSPREMVWIRDLFLRSKADFGKRVVHGHTITTEPEVRHNRIGIDTGAFCSGRLTCLVLEGSATRFLHT